MATAKKVTVKKAAEQQTDIDADINVVLNGIEKYVKTIRSGYEAAKRKNPDQELINLVGLRTKLTRISDMAQAGIRLADTAKREPK